jgi:hypothetical protein
MVVAIVMLLREASCVNVLICRAAQLLFYHHIRSYLRWLHFLNHVYSLIEQK